MKNRLLSLALIFALILTMIPMALAASAGAFAQGGVVSPAMASGAPEGVTGRLIAEPAEEGDPGRARRVAAADYDPAAVYRTMNALRSTYPEGMYWTDASQSYVLSSTISNWGNGGSGAIYRVTGTGCVAFCFRLSDAAFPGADARCVYGFSYDDVRIGDILRVNNDSHSVTVMEKYSDHVVLAEANYDSAVHWGRTMTKREVLQSNYIITRYPAGAAVQSVWNHEMISTPAKPSNLQVTIDYPESQVGDTFHVYVSADNMTGYHVTFWKGDVLDLSVRDVKPTDYVWIKPGSAGHFTVRVEAFNAYGSIVREYPVAVTDPNATGFIDVPADAYYADAVEWALANGITGGTSATTFSPAKTVNRAMAVTFLWRAAGMPEPVTAQNPFTDINRSAYGYAEKAILWAVENDITNGTGGSSFSPGMDVTRGQMMTFLYRAMGEPDKTGDSSWYGDAERWAFRSGLQEGTALAYVRGDDCPRSDVIYYLWKALP